MIPTQTIKAKDLRDDDVWPNGQALGRIVYEKNAVGNDPLWVGITNKDGLVDEWIKPD